MEEVRKNCKTFGFQILAQVGYLVKHLENVCFSNDWDNSCTRWIFGHQVSALPCQTQLRGILQLGKCSDFTWAALSKTCFSPWTLVSNWQKNSHLFPIDKNLFAGCTAWLSQSRRLPTYRSGQGITHQVVNTIIILNSIFTLLSSWELQSQAPLPPSGAQLLKAKSSPASCDQHFIILVSCDQQPYFD